MHRKTCTTAAGIALTLLLAACATQDQVSPQPDIGTATARPAPLPGYLAAGAVDMLQVMPPAPVAGDARDEADRRIFRETRALKDTPRWKMASDDAQLGTAPMLRHFSCALDIELTPQQAPKMLRLLQRSLRDASQAMAQAKDHYKRQRPYQVDAGEICRPRTETDSSFDYPSGHTTAGWSWGLVLAQIAPERASPILARARAIGDSRVVCGVHNASAVSAARQLTGATLAASSATAEYQQDLRDARTELAALRAAPHSRPPLARCEEEAALIRQTVPGH